MGTMRLNRASGCWVDLFDGTRFEGHRCRLHGPADFPGLRVREPDWGDRIQSVRVGPTAYVQCFSGPAFDDTVFWLLPNQAVETSGDFDCPVGVDSIRVYDRPPFAHEPGYAAYMLWAASHLARVRSNGNYSEDDEDGAG
jgi:hypothetical protein